MINILFNYKTNYSLYLSRCKPIIEQMLKENLIDDLINIISIDDFCNKRNIDPIYFTEYDYNHIIQIKNLLNKIKTNPNEIIIDSLLTLQEINILIMKKYLLNKNLSYNKRVKIQVQLYDNSFLQIVSYDSEKDGQPFYKDPGGSIEKTDISHISAAKRELEEELGIILDINRFEQINEYKFKVILSKYEYELYLDQLHLLYIDPEITMIAKIIV